MYRSAKQTFMFIHVGFFFTTLLLDLNLKKNNSLGLLDLEDVI